MIIQTINNILENDGFNSLIDMIFTCAKTQHESKKAKYVQIPKK